MPAVIQLTTLTYKVNDIGNNMADTSTLAITMATLGQSSLVITVLLSKSKSNPAYLPLALFLMALSCLLFEPISQTFGPQFEVFSIIIMLPASLFLGPVLLQYVKVLTAKQKDLYPFFKTKHCILPLLGLIASILTALLPQTVLDALFFSHNPEMSQYVSLLMTFVYVLVLSWIAQSAYYLAAILILLREYHALLVHYFSNTDERKMYWLYVFIGLLSVIWVTGISALSAKNLFDTTLISPLQSAFMALAVVWSLSFLGLMQRPGLEGEKIAEELAKSLSLTEQINEKYQRSALDKSHSKRIAGKLEQLMESQTVYLDPDLSLGKLSKLTGISPNYISQTLNETLEQSFFDYVNNWRIQHAQKLLTETQKSILDIALEVGFNARSSFYKAFKQITQQTPSEFRRRSQKIKYPQD